MRTPNPQEFDVWRRMWLRVQGDPLLLTVALISTITAGFNLGGRLGSLSVFAAVLYTVMFVGGAVTLLGRLRDHLQIESIGLALLIGGYAFAGLRGLARAEDGLEVTRVVLAYCAVAIGLFIRLHVVRKAQRARLYIGRLKR